MIDVTNIHQPVLLDDCVNLVAPALQHEGAVAVDRFPESGAASSSYRY